MTRRLCYNLIFWSLILSNTDGSAVSATPQASDSSQLSSLGSRYRVGIALLAIVLIFLIAGRACQWHGYGERSPFHEMLPADTPLVIEGDKDEVIKFIRSIGLIEPTNADLGSLDALQCTRLLYAAVPAANTDGAACRQSLMNAVNGIEEEWDLNHTYPAQPQTPIQPCPLGGQPVYQSDGQTFSLTCSGPTHQTIYTSTDGLTASNAVAQPLVIVAFVSDTAKLSSSFTPPGFSQVQVISTDPARTQQMLESDAEKMEIRYPQHTSLFIDMLNSQLSTLGLGLNATLPGKRFTITKSDFSGIYSLRATFEDSEYNPDYPVINASLEALPQASTRWAGSVELMKELNILPLAVKEWSQQQPLICAMATNANMEINQLMPTMDSAMSGLTQATFVGEFSDEASAQACAVSGPWGDISDGQNPQCLAQIQDTRVAVNIGDALTAGNHTKVYLPPHRGPVQLGGQLSLISRQDQTSEVYNFCAGVRNGQFWMEIQNADDEQVPDSENP